LDELEKRLRQPLGLASQAESQPTLSEKDFISGFTEQGFKNAVAKARQYITDGDVMQVVLSQRLSAPFRTPPLELYRALRRINPTQYLYFLDLGERHIVGSSPEI